MDIKLHQSDIEAEIADVRYEFVEGTTTTICHIVTKSNAVVTGTNACIHPDTWDELYARGAAYAAALDKLWELEGYCHRKKLLAAGLLPARSK